MAKRRLTVHLRIPRYRHPRNAWRRQLGALAADMAQSRSIRYSDNDHLELIITLNMSPRQIIRHDVDNRLKDIMDALQGRAGGTKAQPTFRPVIPNDHQIYRVTIEKVVGSPKSRDLGHLTIRKHRERPRTSP